MRVRVRVTNSRTMDCHCFPDVEFLYQLFTSFPDANVSVMLSLLLANVNKQQRTVHILASDFDHACLKSVLLNFVQHVNCASRGSNTLDCVYSNVKHAYSAVPLPHFGLSDHLSLLMLPAYVPVRRQAKPTRRIIKTWPEDALAKLQDCFEQTLWDIFELDDFSVYAETINFYIKTCADNVAVEKHIQQYSYARADLSRGVIRAKAAYKRKIEGQLSDGNPWKQWEGIQQLANGKGCSSSNTDKCLERLALSTLKSAFLPLFTYIRTHIDKTDPLMRPFLLLCMVLWDTWNIETAV